MAKASDERSERRQRKGLCRPNAARGNRPGDNLRSAGGAMNSGRCPPDGEGGTRV